MEVLEQQRPLGVSRVDGWPECFQDLRSWCHTDQDELHTPQVTMQDEFNFSIDGQVNTENWGYFENPPVVWINQDLLSPNNITITDEENNNFEFQNSFSTAYVKGDNMSNLPMQSKATANTSNNSSVLKTKGNVLLSSVSILPDDTPVALDVEGSSSFTDFVKLNSSTSARLGSGGGLVKIEPAAAQASVKRAKLKLKIPQHQPSAQGQVGCNLATPEVLKPFADLASSDFDLLNYVCGGSENGNRTTVVPKKEEVMIIDHDYIENVKSVIEENVYIKCEPVSPSSMEAASRASSSLNMPLDQDEDMVADSFDEDEDEESEEWFPSQKSRKGRPAKRTSRKTSSLDSSDGSGSLHNKYRVLRDRNNEASRRSRLNRKQRDTEMRKHKAELEKRNIELKVKADRMEALVKDMRAILLKTVRSRNQQQNNC